MYSTEGYLVSLLSMNKVVDGIKHALDIEGVSRKGVHHEEKLLVIAFIIAMIETLSGMEDAMTAWEE